MKLDDLRDQLRACEAKAENNVVVRAAALREMRDEGLKATGSAMRRLRAYLWLELGLNLLSALLLGGFMASHLELRFLAPALVLDVFALAHVVFGARQLVTLGRVTFDAPVVAVQRELETLRVGRIRMTKWTLLLGPLLWIPVLVVALKGLAGVDTYAVFDRTWLVANVLFGVAFVPGMFLASKRLVDRFAGSPLLARLLRDVAGRNLTAAQAFLDELARFESSDGT
jgi:hypothetical protein